MSDLTPTFHFEGDEVFALHEGKVIASGSDIAAVEASAVEYLDALGKERDTKDKADRKKKATHIVTPNGIKGEILSSVPDVWGSTQVTARFENGTISQVTIHGDDGFEYVAEKTASAKDPLEGLEKRLGAEYGRDKDSLAARLTELGEIAQKAASLVANGAPYSVQQKLDGLRTAALAEASEVREAHDYLESADAEAFAAPQPFRMAAAEQVELGAAAGSDWLEVVAQEMFSEAEGTDFEKLLDEGPLLFVTELDNGALADAGVAREMAVSHIHSKTAGFEGDEVENYREQFVARVEAARRAELAERQETTHKEAAVEKEAHINAPDEALFM